MKNLFLSVAFILGVIAIVVLLLTVYAFFAFSGGDKGDLLRWVHNPLYSATVVTFSIAAIVIGYYKKETMLAKLYEKMDNFFM